MKQTIYYKSTRGDQKEVTAATAILNGIAEDGGLYVPESIPKLSASFEELAALSYQALAERILSLFLTDFTEKEIHHAVSLAYNKKFDTPQIAPLKTRGNVHFLELFHGPTLAFKDMALTLLPYLLKTAVEKTGQTKEVVILTATSGDTGKAALEGFADVEGTKIIVFFPEHGVSRVQKRQMVTQTGKNTYVIGIEGNFDDAQNGVKAMFTDASLRRQLAQNGYIFSSANSINIGRLIPQIVYYWWAYLQLVRHGKAESGQKVNFAVPTGNFGNILAGYYAAKTGLPVGKLICASNKNKVLFDFLSTGTYDRNREFYVTMSPSMDILISSNLERLLYHAAGEDPRLVKTWMKELAENGSYQVPQNVRNEFREFFAGYASEEETAQAIRQVFDQCDYLMDPHTAVAYHVVQQYRAESADNKPVVVVSTASPYKFSKDVLCAIDPRFADADDFSLFAELGKRTNEKIPHPVKELQKRPVLHKTVCKKNEMQSAVTDILGL